MSCLDEKKCTQPCPMRAGKGCWLKLWTRRQRWCLVILVIVLMTFLSVSAAIAESWSTKNKAGGEIVMTDKSCHDGSSTWSAYYYDKDHATTLGCYSVNDDMVHVVWEDGRKSVYPLSLFKLRRPFAMERI